MGEVVDESSELSLPEAAQRLWVRILLISAGVLATVSGATLLFILVGAFDRISSLELRTVDIEIRLATVNERVVEHRSAAQPLVSRIHNTSDRLQGLLEDFSGLRVSLARMGGSFDKLDARVEALYSPGGPGKRFTNDDGDRLRKMIDRGLVEASKNRENLHAVERELGKLEGCCGRSLRSQ